jgi:hypothetical protein
MITNFFNKSKPVVLFVIILILFVFYIAALFLLNFNELSLPFFIKKIGFFIVFIFLLLFLNFIIHKNKLTKSNSFALLLIVLLLGTFYETMFTNNILFANITLLLGLRRMYSLRSGLNTKAKLYDAGFWIGVSILIFSWSIFYLVIVYAAMTIYRKLDFKNIFIPIVGVVTPIIIYFTYCLYFNNLDVFYNKLLFVKDFNFFEYNNFQLLIPITFLTTLLLWSIIALAPTLILAKIHTKRAWNLVLTHLLISAIVIVLTPVKNGAEMFFILFPASVIITKFLEKSASETFKNLILYLFILISIAVYFL